jgi:hypothetical protein
VTPALVAAAPAIAPATHSLGLLVFLDELATPSTSLPHPLSQKERVVYNHASPSACFFFNKAAGFMYAPHAVSM